MIAIDRARILSKKEKKLGGSGMQNLPDNMKNDIMTNVHVFDIRIGNNRARPRSFGSFPASVLTLRLGWISKSDSRKEVH